MILKFLIFCEFILFGNFLLGYCEDDFYLATSAHNGQRYRLSREQLPRDQAAQKCEDNFAHLVVITTSEINDVVFNLVNLSSVLDDGANAVNVGVWIGLLLTPDRMGEWKNGEIYNETGFSDWSPNEPRMGGPNCVQLWGGYFWKWDDNYCDIPNYFVCQDQDPTTYNIARVEEITDSILSLPTNISVDRNVVTVLSTRVDNLLDTEAPTGSSNEILMAVDDITSNYNASMGDLKIDRKNIEIEIVSVSTNKVENSSGITLGSEISEATENGASIFLSEELLSETLQRNNLTTLQIGSVVYKQPSLFQDSGEVPEQGQTLFEDINPSRRSEPIVLGHVVSIDVNDAIMSNLKSPVVIQYQFTDDVMENATTTNVTSSAYRKETEMQCVFWDFDLSGGSWSSEGCQTIMMNRSDDGRTMVNCSCNHMTHFGVILDTTFYYEPEFLTYVTICGCALSIVCLLATIFTNLYFRQLRTKLPQQILIHVCLSLIFLDSVFLVGIDQRDYVTLCYVTTAMLHYGVLLSWAWMLTEAVFLLRTLVLSSVGSVSGRWFIWIASLLCYLVPGGIVFAVAKLTGDDYRSDRFCWLSSQHLMYSIVIPIAVVLGINILIFLIIMYNITFRSQMFKKHLDLQRISQAIRRALCMIFVLGLPWLFGYIMLLAKDEQATRVFSIIFTVFNSLQGFAIFILYCVRQENVRNLWFKPVRQQYRKTFKFLREKQAVRRFTNDTQEKQTSERVLSKLSLDSVKTTPLSSPAKVAPLKKNTPKNSPLRQNPPPLPTPPSQKPSPLVTNGNYTPSPLVTSSNRTPSPLVAKSNHITSPLVTSSNHIPSPLVASNTHTLSPEVASSNHTPSPLVVSSNHKPQALNTETDQQLISNSPTKPLTLPLKQPYRSNQIPSPSNQTLPKIPFSSNQLPTINKTPSPLVTKKQPFLNKEPFLVAKSNQTPAKQPSPPPYHQNKNPPFLKKKTTQSPFTDIQQSFNAPNIEPFPVLKPVNQTPLKPKQPETKPFAILKPTHNTPMPSTFKKAPVPLPAQTPTNTNIFLPNGNRKMFLPSKKPTNI